MKLYLLKRTSKPEYDVMNGQVIAAACESDARSFAARNHGDEGRAAWMSPELVTCTKIAKRTSHPAGLVLEDFTLIRCLSR